MSSKIYCKNCKNFRPGGGTIDGIFWYDTCFMFTIPHDGIQYPNDCAKTNLNNDCKHYQRTWWKFWVAK